MRPGDAHQTRRSVQLSHPNARTSRHCIAHRHGNKGLLGVPGCAVPETMPYNDSAVAEPARSLRLKYCHSRNEATQFASPPCLWPVGTEAAAGGRSQQPSCYQMARRSKATDGSVRPVWKGLVGESTGYYTFH
jgi:hypothetical protein